MFDPRPYDFSTLDPDFVALVRELQVHQQCGSPEPELIFGLSHATRGTGEIVEVGTYVGTSTICLAKAQMLKGDGRAITAVDIKKQPSLDATLERAGVTDFVQLVTSRSNDLAASWDRPIELLWIDGDHSYEGCLMDILAWERHVQPGGIVAFHDYANGTGVAQAIRDSLVRMPWKYRVALDRGISSIFVMEKIAGNDEPAWVCKCDPMAAYPELPGLLEAKPFG